MPKGKRRAQTYKKLTKTKREITALKKKIAAAKVKAAKAAKAVKPRRIKLPKSGAPKPRRNKEGQLIYSF